MNSLSDLESFVRDQPDRRRHRASVERLPAHGGVSVWDGVWPWVTPQDAELNLDHLTRRN